KGPKLLDGKDMATGKANYGLDTQIEGMQYAMIKRCPVVGGKIKSFDAKKAESIPGVNQVFTLKTPDFPSGFDKPLGGVVVVARNTWAAWKALDAIEVEWDFGPNADYDTDQYLDDLEAKVKKEGLIKRESGDVKQSLQEADQVLTSVYRIPHSSHSPMEPPCAVAQVKGNECEIWAPTQNPQWVKGSVAGALAEILEQKAEDIKVKVNITLLGGGFGRKSKPDFVVEAALIAQEVGTPIKLMWKREHDVQHDFYHACGVQQIKVGIDKDNKVKAWNHQTIFPPIGGTASPQAIQPSDGELGLGFVDFPFDVPNICCETNEARAHTRIGWVRSVSNIQHAFATCSMMDEIAETRQMDAIANALDMLGKDRIFPIKDLVESYSNYNEPIEDFPWETARFRKVIELVRDKSGWGEQLGKGEAWGFAAHRSFLTYVAAVVKVKVVKNNKVTIPEVHYAVDCGKVINEERVKSQFEGGAVFGTSIALKSAITFKEGRAQQSNFNNFQVARHGEDPQKIFVYLVPSEEKPTGVGEPPVPPIAPAIANALYQITGKRHRTLPIDLQA
ncbi:MAG: molybdopterin cofactor-binding domain-containing protein, partial [Bacteroidota bacterium]